MENKLTEEEVFDILRNEKWDEEKNLRQYMKDHKEDWEKDFGEWLRNNVNFRD